MPVFAVLLSGDILPDAVLEFHLLILAVDAVADADESCGKVQLAPVGTCILDIAEIKFELSESLL